MTYWQLKLRKQSHTVLWTYTFYFFRTSIGERVLICNIFMLQLDWYIKVVYYGKITVTVPVVGSNIAITMWKTDVSITEKMSTCCSGDTVWNTRNYLKKKMFSHCIHLWIYSEIFFSLKAIVELQKIKTAQDMQWRSIKSWKTQEK